MDTESDGSERWEDFFGSSTDIGPSVLGYLDTLANDFNEEAKQLIESCSHKASTPLLHSPPTGIQIKPAGGHLFAVPRPEDDGAAVEIIPSQEGKGPGSGVLTPASATRTIAPPATVLVGSAGGGVRKPSNKFFQLVSPNVLRMVSNTSTGYSSRIGTSPDTCTPPGGNAQPAAATPNDTVSRKPVKPSRAKHASAATMAATLGSHTNLPLSSNISNLIDNVDPCRRQKLTAKSFRERVRDHSSSCDESMDTPTRFKDVHGGGLIGQSDEEPLVEGLQNVSSLQRKIRSLTVDLEQNGTSDKERLPSDSTSEELSLAAQQTQWQMRHSLCEDGDSTAVLRTGTSRSGMTNHEQFEDDAFVKNCVDSSAECRNTIVEARNVHLKLGRFDGCSTQGSSDERRKQRTDPAEAQFYEPSDGKACSVSELAKLSLRSGSDRTSFSETTTPFSASTSTPSLDTTNGSVYSSKVSLVVPPPSTPLINARQLSASSVCSFASSSSSSSGSETHLLGGKGRAPPSYQASVESLADPSESEQANHPRFAGTDDGGVVGVELAGNHPGGGGCVDGTAACGSGCDGTGNTVMTMCERAVREIIDSESSYVKDLGQVIRGYLEDWKERACLKPNQLGVLFSNIQQIYDFNFTLLNRLRDARGDPVRISDCFIDLHVDFSCYTLYCTSYPEAISLLTTLLQATHTNALLVSTQKMLKHTLPLGSYLLKPVQRILKYHLLLENLRKHCSDQQVVRAHELMKKVAKNIDQMKKNLDQKRLVKELAGILDGWLGPDLSVLGDLLREGYLTEQAKSRFALLFQSMLIIAKPKEDKRLQFRTYIPCKNLMLVEHLPGEPASFNVIPFDDPRGVLKLTARSREEKRQWTQQIKQAMLLHYSDIPKRAITLVLSLGDEDERFTDKPYWKRPTNNSPVPEYLQRRQQFRRSEMRMRSKKNYLKKDALTPTFRSYSSDLEQAEPEPVSSSSAECPHHHTHGQDDCKCGSVKRQLQDKIINQRTEGASQCTTPPASPAANNPPRSRSESRREGEEAERMKKSLYERRKLTQVVPVKKQSAKDTAGPDNVEHGINAYSSTMIPKRISEIRKRRPKTLTGSSTFYTELDAAHSGSSLETPTTPDCGSEERHSKPISIAERGAAEAEDASRLAGPSRSLPITVELQLATTAEPAVNGEASAVKKGAHMKDSEIISKLILDAEPFSKVLNKPLTKKKSFDSSTCSRPVLNSPTPKPNLPNTEPPSEEDDDHDDGPTLTDGPCSRDGQRGGSVPDASSGGEPIYESLLRNVHVPYKYAPASLARHSLPCATDSRSNTCQQLLEANGQPVAPLGAKKTRPESDYVTLAFSKAGLLEKIEGYAAGSHDDGVGQRHGLPQPSAKGGYSKTPQLLRNSDTNISYHRESNATRRPRTDGGDGEDGAEAEEVAALHLLSASPRLCNMSVEENGSAPWVSPKPNFLERQGSLNMKATSTSTGQKTILQRFISLHSSALSSDSSNLVPKGGSRPVQRKLSEPNGGYGGCGDRGSVAHIYKLGSMDMGSRIAHLDYADPKTLFAQPAEASPSASLLSVSSSFGSKDQQPNIFINRCSLKSQAPPEGGGTYDQRDSVLASSSSSDSIRSDELKPSGGGTADDDGNDADSFYERTVEECLEYDFRDSAVYSGDDNDRRTIPGSAGGEHQNVYETLAPPAPRAEHSAHSASRQSVASGQRHSGTIPPPIPTKPAHLGGAKRFVSAVVGSPPTAAPKPSNSRGWVLQQVKRFQ